MAEGYAFPTGVEDGFHVELENGVTYEFKAEFKRWDVVKGTGSSVWITDELPDEQYTSNGDLWFDNTEDTMQLFLWHEESGAWLPVAPPTTLESRIEQGEKVQEQILIEIAHLMGETSALEGRIKVGEGVQQDIQSDVTTLQNKVNALEGVVGQHRFDYDIGNKNPRAGQMNGQNEAMEIVRPVDQIKFLALSDTDRDGKPVGLDKIQQGDVLRILWP